MTSLPGPGARPPVVVVDRHGDALAYWQQAHAACEPPFAVLHVDSHADMHLDWDQEEGAGPCKVWQPPPRGRMRHQLLAAVNITNFVTAAIYLGIVDAVVWLRSDFPRGSYNSPPPGHHRRLLAVPDYGRPPDPGGGGGAWPSRHVSKREQDRRPLIWDWDLADGSFRSYGPRLAHEGLREVLAGPPAEVLLPGAVLAEAPPVEGNTLFEDRPRTLASGLAPAEGTGVEFAHSVVTRRQLEAGELGTVRRVLRSHGEAGRWVLDVDLDFFSTSCPSLAIVLERHSWHSREASTTFAAWATRLSGIVSGHLERECSGDLFSESCFQATAQVIFRLGRLPAARAGVLTAADILAMLRAVHPACKPPQDALRALASAVNGLTPEQRLQWEALDGEDWHWVMQSRCPHHHATVQEVRAEARRLAPLLAGLGPEPPALVTVARSSDGYLPDDVAAVAEWETLLLVRRTWPGAAAGWPGGTFPPEAEAFTAEHIAEVLRGVHFHEADATSGRLSARSWPFVSDPRPFERAD